MFSVRSATRTTDTYTELSFRHVESWGFFDTSGPLSDVASMIVLLGDETSGPLLGFTSLAPGVDCPLGPPHGHCSDNFRLSIRGVLTMGRELYPPGRFRFQDGWKTYPTNNNSCGPGGGWEIELFADRRGLRASEVVGGPEIEAMMAMAGQQLASMFGLGHLVAEPPPDMCGPSALATTLGPTENSGKLNGSFDDHASWTAVGSATRVAVALLGEPERGPVVILSATSPNEVAFPRACFDTEVFHLVVAGSGSIGERAYESGDMRIQHASTWCEPVTAGADGLHELIVLGDRRRVDAAAGDDETWLSSLGGIVRDLADELSARQPAGVA